MSGLQARLAGRRGALALDVDFKAAPRAVTALSGRSGAGKTTLLRALAGLERLEGEVRMGGEVWQDGRRFLPPHRRRVGYVFQQGALFPHLNVRGNLDYARKRSGAAPAELERLAAAVSVEHLLERSPERLSGGERARVALARALLTRPELLLLDEPFAGLDGEARAALLPTLKAVLTELQAPTLLVSHDAAEIAALAEAVLVLQGGRVRSAGAPLADPSLAGVPEAEVRRLAGLALAAGLGGPSSGSVGLSSGAA